MYNFVEVAFARAVANDENYTDGKLIMNFVEADVYAECVDEFGHCDMTEYLDMFDEVAESFLQNVVDKDFEYC